MGMPIAGSCGERNAPCRAASRRGSNGRRGSCAGSHRSTGKVAVTSEIAAFFAERRVDPQYLGKAASEIPQDQLSLINRIIATADDADNSVYTHSTLTSLVLGALESAATDQYVPYYMTIGNNTWAVELGSTVLDDGVTANPNFIPL